MAKVGDAISYSGGTFTLDKGKYLVLWSDRYDGTPDISTRSEIQGRLAINGVATSTTAAQGYIRAGTGQDEAVLAGSGIIEASADGTTLEVIFYRTDDLADTVTRVVDWGGVSIVQLDDSFNYARYITTTTQSASASEVTWADVTWDLNVEQDDGFSRSGGQITLSRAGRYLVTYGLPIVETTTRTEYNTRLTLNDVEVEGTRVSTYIRNANSTSDGALAYGGIIQANAGDVLALENIRTEGVTATFQTGINLQILELPESAGTFIAEATTGNMNPASDTEFAWDTIAQISRDSFTMAAPTDSFIEVDKADDYLFFFAQMADNSGVARGYPTGRISINDTIQTHGGAVGQYCRNTGTADDCGYSAGLLLADLSPGDNISLENFALGAAGSITNDHGAFSGLRLGSIFPFDNLKPGKLGQGYTFDGVNDYIRVDSPGLPTGDFTYAFWVYPENKERIIYAADGTSDEFAIDIVSATNLLELVMDTNTYNSTNPISIGEWNHIAVTRSGSTVTIYLNGEEDSTRSDSTTLSFSTCPLLLGVDADSGCVGDLSNFFEGSLDDVRIYNRGLSANDIKRMYELGATTRISKVSTTPRASGALASGLVGHWTFDARDLLINVADSSGSGNKGEIKGQAATTTAIGVFGQAIDFDGSDDYITMGDQNSLDFGTGDFAGCAWIKSTETSTDTIFGKRTGGGVGWLFRRDGSNDRLNLRVDDGPAEPDYNSTSGLVDINDGEWHHACFSVDRSADVTFYIDGNFAGNADITASSGSLDNANPFCIGANNCDSTPVNLWDGSIDDARVFNRTLSETEIVEIYKAARAKANTTQKTEISSLVAHWTFDGKDMYQNVADVSGNGIHGAINGQAATTTTFGAIGQALELDGDDDFVDLGSIGVGNPLRLNGSNATFSFWFKQDGFIDTFGRILDKSDGTTGSNGYGIWLGGTGGTNRGIGVSVNNSSWRTDSEEVYQFGEWTHGVIEIDSSGNISLYINGQSVSGDFYIGSATPIPDATTNMRLGMWNHTTDRALDGALDDIRIYNRALSSAEIDRLYQLGK